MNEEGRNRELKKITLENYVILKNINMTKSVYNQNWPDDIRARTFAFVVSDGKGYTVVMKCLHTLIDTGAFCDVKPEIKKTHHLFTHPFT